MPKLKLRFSATSHRDLKDIFNYLHPRNPQAANSVINAIEKSIALLVEHPYAARFTDMKDVRVRPIARYPFLIF